MVKVLVTGTFRRCRQGLSHTKRLRYDESGSTFYTSHNDCAILMVYACDALGSNFEAQDMTIMTAWRSSYRQRGEPSQKTAFQLFGTALNSYVDCVLFFSGFATADDPYGNRNERLFLTQLKRKANLDGKWHKTKLHKQYRIYFPYHGRLCRQGPSQKSARPGTVCSSAICLFAYIELDRELLVPWTSILSS